MTNLAGSKRLSRVANSVKWWIYTHCGPLSLRGSLPSSTLCQPWRREWCPGWSLQSGPSWSTDPSTGIFMSGIRWDKPLILNYHTIFWKLSSLRITCGRFPWPWRSGSTGGQRRRPRTGTSSGQSSAQITNFDLNHVSKSNHQIWFKSKMSAHKFPWYVQS